MSGLPPKREPENIGEKILISLQKLDTGIKDINKNISKLSSQENLNPLKTVPSLTSSGDEENEVKRRPKIAYGRWMNFIFLPATFGLVAFAVFQNHSVENQIQSSIVDTNKNMQKTFEELIKDGEFKKAFSIFNKKTTDATMELKLTKDQLASTEKSFAEKFSRMQKDSKDGSDELKSTSGKLAEAFDSLKTRFEAFESSTQKSLQDSLTTIKTDFGTKLVEIKKELTSLTNTQIGALDTKLSKRVDPIEKNLKQVDNSLYNLDRIFKTPDSGKMGAVQIAIDDGSGMDAYNYQEAVDSVLSVMSDSIRRTPKRKVGLVIGHDARVAVKAKTDIQYDADFQNLKRDSANFRVDRNSTTNHLEFLESSISQLSFVKDESRKTLILITGSTQKIPQSGADLVKNCDQGNLSLFVIQLTSGFGDSPSAILSGIGTESGGQFTTLYFPTGQQGEKMEKNKALLRRTLLNYLGLSESIDR